MRQNITVNEVVGVTPDGIVYVLEDLFHHDSENFAQAFKGATGKALRPITQKQYEWRTDHENACEELQELWKMQVHEDATQKGLDDWVSEVLWIDGDDALFSDVEHDNYIIEEATHYLRQLPEYEDEEIWGFEWDGCGRIFETFDTMAPRFELMPNTVLWFDINEFERKEG